MLPDLLERLFGLPLFGYISFRMAMAAFTAFVSALVLGPIAIRWLVRHRVGEDVKKTDSPELAALAERMGKMATPTMGGSFLIVSLIGSILLWARLDNPFVVLGVLLTAGLAAVGFVDDFKKLKIPGSKGLSRSAKMTGLTVVSLAALFGVVFYARISDRPTLLSLYPPFFKDAVIPIGSWPWIGPIAFVAFEWFVIVGTANAANITDGLDGLAAGCMVISGAVLAMFCYVTGRPDWTGYLNVPYVAAASEMAVVGGALCGACLGFLWFNAFPARVFMGDSGSLPLGGLLAWMALIAKQELVLPLIAFVFVAELFSSWLQTFWFRRTGGRRLFTVAPAHHAFQLHGGLFQRGGVAWHEVTIVIRFWIVATVCGVASLALLKVR